ncbi:MAG: exodeoxyribonuclease V subunit gamma [Neisseriaceae bacterium]|nr:exodeoxyribonuclease V subunit gamma [Neisseriaceae bacterium]
MSISLFRSDRIETLVQKLADLMQKNPQKNIFLPTEILIASDGMKHFINLSLAKELGVAMNIRYSKVHSFFWRILYESNKNQIKPFRYCYAPEILQWQILNIFQTDKMPKTVKNAVHHYLKSHDTAAYGLSQTMAKLFEQYMIYRPNWIRSWSKNELIGKLGDDEIWQKDLWLAILTSLNAPNRVELLDNLLDKLNNKTLSFRLPERVFVFAAGALSPLYLQLFNALSQHSHIHLLVLAPSCAYWGDSRQGDLDANPMLASLGGQSRDFFDLLNEINFDEDDEYFTTDEIDHNTSLLHRVQYAIRHYQPLENIEKTTPDNSIVLHSAYSPVRELHAVKDAILYFLQENPQYSVDDIAVLSPNIDHYAPYIAAVFGDSAADGVALPYSIADTAIRVGNPYLQAWSALLAVFESRFEVEKVLALFDYDCILHRAHLSRNDLPTIYQLIDHLNIYFAWDTNERQQYGGANDDLFTWSQALNRLCAGLMLPENSAYWQGIAPLHLDISLLPVVQQFAQFIETLQCFRHQWQQAATPDKWAERLRQIHQHLLDEDNKNSTPFFTQIDNWQEQCRIAQLDIPLNTHTITAFLQNMLNNPTQQGFLRGGISFGSLVPLRSLPFAFLGLLGMDANSFPRPSVKLPFDLMKIKPQKGDRSRRDDDRYLFLETIISARSVLYLSYTGKDIRNDSALAFSELIWELGDTLTVLSNNEKEFWENHTVQHPLQPFSPKYFVAHPHSGSLKLSFRQRYAHALNTPPTPKIKKSPITTSHSTLPHTIDWINFVRCCLYPNRQWLQQHLLWQAPPVYRSTPHTNEPFTVQYKRHGTEILTAYTQHGVAITPQMTAQNYFPAGFLGKNACQQYQSAAHTLSQHIDSWGETLSFCVEVVLENAHSSSNNSTHILSGSLNNMDWKMQQRLILDGDENDKIHINALLTLWLEHLIANIQWEQITTHIFRPIAKHNLCFMPMEREVAQHYLSTWLALYTHSLQYITYFFPKTAWALVNEEKEQHQQYQDLYQWLTSQQDFNQSPKEIRHFARTIIGKVYFSTWQSSQKHTGEGEYEENKMLFNEHNALYTPLFAELPPTAINTLEFLTTAITLLLPLKENMKSLQNPLF